MKVNLKRLLVALVVITLVLPTAFQSRSVHAATVSFKKKNLTLTGEGVTYTLKVNNKPQNAKLNWSSSAPSVATVNGLGQVTAAGKGTTNITCLVTYANKSVKKLTCKVTVKVPATEVKINNAKLMNNAQQMLVGEKYDFNRTITPKGSSDKTYWVIKDEDIATVDSNGVVTALKPGITQLEARSGENKKAAMDPLNNVTYAINIHITEPVAKVDSCKLTDDKVVTINFSQPMSKASLINSANKLNTNNVIIKGMKVNEVTAADLGAIKPSLSSDGKILTLTATNAWDGVYSIQIESDATTQNGIAFQGYDEEIDCTDTSIPTFDSVTVDDTGVIVLIKFSKEIDITGLVVALNDTTLNQATQDILMNTSNYVLQSDKKTIQLDLSQIVQTDKNKYIELALSGIKDLKGNYTEPYHSRFGIYTDTTPKSNASVQYAERTGRNTITVHFSKSIQYPGFMTLNNEFVYGVVNKTDKTCVDYTISSTANINANGYITGTVNGWMSYNANTQGTATTITVDMSVGNAKPVLTGYELVTTQNNGTMVNSIVLTYNKNVFLSNTTGYLSGSYRDAASNIGTCYLTYAATVTDNVVTLILDPSSTIGMGVYSINIPSYFVNDSYSNYNDSTVIELTSTSLSAATLPEPTSITQLESNPSIIYVNFAHKLDVASAETSTNYSVDMTYPYSARLISNSSTGAVVELTFANGMIPLNSYYPVNINNVAGYNGSYGPIVKYKKIMKLNENVAPTVKSAELSGTTITIKFSEKIQGTPAFEVYNFGTKIDLNSSTAYSMREDTLIITLAQTVVGNNVTVTQATGCSIKDLVGNQAIIPSQLSVTVR